MTDPEDKDQVEQTGGTEENGRNPAVEMARQKLAEAYASEPKADDMAREVIADEDTGDMSKHELYMKRLMESGDPMSVIKHKWHTYYELLSDEEKHQVWGEYHAKQRSLEKPAEPEQIVAAPAEKPLTTTQKRIKNLAELKEQALKPVAKHQSKIKLQLKSIAFGLSMGALVMLILLFGLFNERVITPFITPSKSVTNTPIIGDSVIATGSDPKIIIPKINVEVPVVYTAKSTSEQDIQNSLEDGVVHYPDTAMPGQNGNGVMFGHSSNNILNKGKYKFAFLFLKGLGIGDTFSLEKDGKRYVYTVFRKDIVDPTDVSVLNSYPDKTATMTLITCDPPGTSLKRLVVVGEQISPAPAANIAAITQPAPLPQNNILPSNAPTLWSRIIDFFDF